MQDRFYRTVCKASYVVYRSPVPDEWKKNSDLVPVTTKSFDRLGLMEEHMRYYTLYKVINKSQ
jgi:hypothetical protein